MYTLFKFKTNLYYHVFHVYLIVIIYSIMFWTDFGDTPKVEAARMDGSNRYSVITRDTPGFSRLRHPNDVIIDLNTDLIYFCDGSAGIIAAATLIGNKGVMVVNRTDNPLLRRSQPATTYIRQPQSLAMRHLAAEHRDNDADTDETELFWSDPNLHMVTSTDVITTNRATSGITKTHLRPLLSSTTLYKPLAVQFVSANGHKPGGA